MRGACRDPAGSSPCCGRRASRSSRGTLLKGAATVEYYQAQAVARRRKLLRESARRPFERVHLRRPPSDPTTTKIPVLPGILHKADEGIRTLDLRHGKATL